MHTASARPGQWMCFVGACQEKPRSFLNHHQQEKHQQDHANVNCPECNQLFSAKRNLKRHVRIKHKTVEANISRKINLLAVLRRNVYKGSHHCKFSVEEN